MPKSLNEKALCYMGISGWNYPDWRGSFYPPRLAQRHAVTLKKMTVLNNVAKL